MTITVELSSAGNPDRGQDPTRPVYGAENMQMEVSSTEEASRRVLEYIDRYNLGAGNFTGGLVCLDGKPTARISYNGRVQQLSGQEA